MGLKTLLVCLTSPETAETLMKAAVPLARKHGAHLIGLHVIEALLVYPGIAMHIPEPAFTTFNTSQKNTAAAIRKIFTKHTTNEDFVSEFRLVRAESFTASEQMVSSARAADLVLMAHDDKEHERFDRRQAQIEVIRESGRPVIVLPPDYDGPEIGANLLLGWSDTREATRAAHDLLDVADKGAKLTILRVGKPPKDPIQDSNAIDIAEMFSRHGLKPSLDYREPAGESTANILDEVAFEKGADLIVTGAFGHSRAYDFVLGAVTYGLLRDLRLPVLFSK
jgi:nucleotide-binding universal stress UspA family protein